MFLRLKACQTASLQNGFVSVRDYRLPLSQIEPPTDRMADTDLALAIKLDTAEEADKAVREFVLNIAAARKKSKLAGKPLFVLPNWKFKTEEMAVSFSVLAVALLEKTTKERFHTGRLDTGHEGHLMMALGCGMTEEKFLAALAGLEEGDECDKCGKKADLHKCGGCGMRRYCGKDCQKADWKGHKETCKKSSDVYKTAGMTIV